MNLAKLDMVLVINFVFCCLILFLGAKRWRSSGVNAFILVGLGFTMFGISHAIGILGPQGIVSSEMVTILKTPLIWVRGFGYVLVIIGLLV